MQVLGVSMSKRNKPNDIWKQINLNPVHPTTCWLWTGRPNDKGMGYFQIGGKKIIVYRLVYWITHPTWDINNSREFILHTCVDALGNSVDNPLCCNPAHLRPGTHEENMIDMMVRGRRGLHKDAVRDILDIMKGGNELELTHEQIAKLVGAKHGIEIARSTITDIISGRRRLTLKNRLDEEDRVVKESGKNDEQQTS
jgi:hypothetical protein